MSIKQPVMFERFDKVVFKPVNSAQKYKAIINDDSIIEGKYNEITHFLEFEDSSIQNQILKFFRIDKDKIIKSYHSYTIIYKERLNLSPSMQERINYSIGFRYNEEDTSKKNNKLFMKITFDKYNKNNNVVYMENKINSRILNDKKRSLKSVQTNPKNKSIRLYQNKPNQQVKVTPKIIEIEKNIEEFNTICEDMLPKLHDELNAEIEMEYLKQKGVFNETIRRLGHKKSSKSQGGIKSRRKLRRK
jgi:hypothetical protein